LQWISGLCVAQQQAGVIQLENGDPAGEKRRENRLATTKRVTGYLGWQTAAAIPANKVKQLRHTIVAAHVVAQSFTWVGASLQVRSCCVRFSVAAPQQPSAQQQHLGHWRARKATTS
jgi:hypothetical protein